MNYLHKETSNASWFKLSLIEQMANVGSEVFRAISWKNKGDSQYSRLAFERALELLDLTAADPKNKKRLKEVLRVREALGDYFVGDNFYNSGDLEWQNYFYHFNFAARSGR